MYLFVKTQYLNNVVIAFLLIILWVGVATYADIRFKAAAGSFNLDFWIGLVCYCSTGLIALATFQKQSWGWIIIVWNIMSLALSLFLSVALYHEPFTIKRKVAAVLLLVAILMAD